MSLELVDAALGKVKADLVVRGGALVNVYTGEVVEGVDVAVKGSRVAYVGDASHLIGDETKVLDAKGLYVAPGFIDAHTHIDLYVSPVEVARGALLHGTTSLIAEPDELANVLGFRGVKLFVEQVRELPIKVYVLIPLVCPQDPLFDENPPLKVEEVEEALRWPEVIGLGEVVGWPRLLDGDEDYWSKIEAARRAGKVVEGHTAGARGAKLQGYVAAGIYSCHEPITAEEAVERLRLGVHVMVREGSLRRDMERVLPGVLASKVRLDNVSLVTDHVDPVDMLRLGYMDHLVRRAIELGVDPVDAIRMATLNPARRFHLDHLIGGIGPGREADMVLLRSLERVKVKATVSRGRVAMVDGRVVAPLSPPPCPPWAMDTVKVRRLQPEDFKVRAPIEEGRVRVRVMDLVSETLTREALEEVRVVEGEVELPRGHLAVAVIDRHGHSGRVALGVLRGLGAEPGGVASTLNFDENNMVVLGRSPMDMAAAASRVAEMRGGIALVDDGRLVGELDMPLAGVMSLRGLEEVASRLARLNEELRAMGCRFEKPLNVLLFITFVTLPELRLSVRGLVDVKRRRLVPLIEPQP